MLKNFKFKHCWVTEKNETIIMPQFICIIDVMCSEFLQHSWESLE